MGSKKGMGVGMVFIFIVAALTFALIMIFGYKAIGDFTEKGENVEFYQFKTGLEKSVKQIYTEYGSVRVTQFGLPIKYEKVCFVDLSKKFNSEFCKVDPVACDVWKDAGNYAGADQNVFLKPAADIAIKVYQIDVGAKGFLCVPVKQGKIKLRLEGKGDRTLLSSAN